MGIERRAAVVEQVRSRVSELQEVILGAVQADLDAYRTLAPDQLRDVRGIAAWALLQIVDAWLQDGELGDTDLARFRGIGAARAEDGRPLPDVLRAYRVAAVAAVDTILDLGGDQLEIRDVRAITRVVLTAIDQASEAIITGYTSAGDRLANDRGRALRELLDDLLVGRQSSPGAFAARSARLGHRAPARPIVLVISPITPAPGPEQLLAAATELLDDLGSTEDASPHLLTAHESRAVVVLPAEARPPFEHLLLVREWRGCAVPAVNSSQVAAAHQLANHALDTAPVHAFTNRALLDQGDAEVLALLAARPGADPARTAKAVLGPLADTTHLLLLDGLAAHLATGNATDAAAALGLHPQTLRYRLRRAQDLTSRDPRQPWHRLVLEVAVHATLRERHT